MHTGSVLDILTRLVVKKRKKKVIMKFFFVTVVSGKAHSRRYTRNISKCPIQCKHFFQKMNNESWGDKVNMTV